MFKLFAPLFGNLSPGLIIVLLGCLIRRAFGTNEATVGYYFLHISSLSNNIAANGIQVSLDWQFLN